MVKIGQMGIGLVVSAWALINPLGASAQLAPAPPPSQGTAMPPAAMLANPYLNPYLNPYMNPAATLQPMNANNALLYLYAANSANGGIGAGRISGTRAQAPRSRAAELPNSVARPGGGAARYFNPGPVNVNGAGRYYNQRGRYFNNNGR
jgi:hypothetical protein